MVYPAAEKYFSDFLCSIEHQSYTDFDLIIGNDGLKRFDVSSCRLNVRVVELSGTPAEIRESGLRFLREQGYEQAIFGDCDDFFSPNRVEVSLRLLKEYQLVVNDLDLVDSDGVLVRPGYLSTRIRDGERISADFVRDKNVLGLSNTAIRVSCLPTSRIPADLLAVDWFVFASILEGGGRGVFSSEACTYYRQHGGNTAGLGTQSPQSILKAVRVKARHYTALTEAGLEGYREPAVAFRELQKRLLDDEVFRDRYLDFVDSNRKDFAFWWENALLLENQR